METETGTAPPTFDVVVVGAGYAGLIATNRFLGSLTHEERAGVRLTVVNPREDFVERIRLHQLAAGSVSSVTTPLATLVHPAAHVLPGRATRIDRRRRTVQVHTGTGMAELSWTHLVYAVGSAGATSIPGAEDNAFVIGDLEGAQRARTAVDAAGERPRILVIGGGLTGVETSSELAELHPSADVVLVSATRVVAGMRDSARSAIMRRLRRLGVEIVESTPVLEVEESKVRLADGRLVGFDVCVVATAFDVPQLAAVSGFDVDEQGRLRVDQTLRCPEDPCVLGAGDAVAVAGVLGARLRMACSVALPMGGHVAEVLLSALREQPAAPFSMGYSAQCVSLGRRHGYIQLVHADDSPRRLHIGGVLGARVKEAVCRRVLESPARESSHPGDYTWKRGAVAS